jgi:glycosyltransferase involved in cell wall biosynthesis
MKKPRAEQIMVRRPIGSVAIVNPLGDFGITTYSFELAEGLEANGVRVDFYTGDASPLSELPAHHQHRCFPVLGSLLLRQRRILQSRTAGAEGLETSAQGDLPHAASTAPDAAVPVRRWEKRFRRSLLSTELAVYLRSRDYDLVWTQWPDVYGTAFWSTCRALGLRLAHTVHNVVPHDSSRERVPQLCRVYSACDRLFVHSEQARGDFEELFPEFRDRLFVSPHGLYTIYPRCPQARERRRKELGLGERQLVALVCGGIRPYKNVDALIAALADPRCAQAALVVAGEESGYDDGSSLDPLARTRRLAIEAGVADRVRLIPRFLRSTEIAELVEAVDILALPYRKGFGSGLLLLGMTFGKHVLITDTGGAGEYVGDYPAHTLLRGIAVPDVAAGLRRAMDSIGSQAAAPAPRSPRLEWPAIAQRSLAALQGAP